MPISSVSAVIALRFEIAMNLVKKSLDANQNSSAVTWGYFFLRVSAGLMIFYIHGLHKLEAGLEYMRDGKPWKLLEEVAGMHAPAPVASAWAATIIQFVCSLFIVGGLFTRLNAVLLTGALSGAILQNVLAGRDPQLAILYTLVVVTIALVGGGRFSLDAVLNKRCGHVGQGTA
jgi:putative oxidoreductase